MNFCNIVFHKKVQQFIVALILFNAITLGLATNLSIMSKYGDIINLLDKITIYIFTIEIILRIGAKKLDFFKDPWSIFDFTIVAISLAPNTGVFSILRSLRVIRVLRLISVSSNLKVIVNALIISISNIFWLTILTAIIYYIFAVIGTNLYQKTVPEYFSSLADSLFTLFQLTTLDGWSDLARKTEAIHPHSTVFFVLFILISVFVVLNLFIAVLVQGVNDAALEENTKNKDKIESLEHHNEELLQKMQKLEEKLDLLLKKADK